MNKIEIRHSYDSDVEQIRLLYAEPSNYAATLQLPFPSPAAWAKKFSPMPEGSYSLVACKGDEIVGQLGLSVESNPRRKHAGYIGMGVKSSARRIGVGSALMSAMIELAEQWLAVQRIELSVYTDNDAAIGLYKKFGFNVEGTLRQYAFRNGAFVDVHVMSRLKVHHEFENA